MGSLFKYINGSTFPKTYLFSIVTSLLFMVWAPVVVAEEEHEEGSHEFHRHHLALNIGNVQNDDGSVHGLGGGVDYEYRFNRWFGLGGSVEYAGGDFEHWLISVPLFFHPYKGFRLAVAAGTEIHKEEEEHTKERDWVIRTGVGYQFFFTERYNIAPMFIVDFSEHETLFVYGLSFGIGF